MTTPDQDLYYYFGTITVGVQQMESQIAAVVAQPVSPQIALQDILLAIYLIGVFIASIRLGVGLFQIVQHYRQSEQLTMPGYTLLLSPETHLPFSFFGFLFQSASAKYTPQEIDQITRHEMTHIKEHHSVDVLLTELLTIVFWCSPLIYCYKRSLRNLHEYLADENVLRKTSKKQYGQLLLQQFQQGPGMAMANNFIHSQLKKRIHMMTKKRSSDTARWKYLLVIPILAGLFFALANTDLHAQKQNTDKTESKMNTERMHPVFKARNQGDPIYTVVEEMPRFKGCEEVADKIERERCAQEKLLKFIYTNIKYPEAARKAGIEGTVIVRFVIDKTGKVTSPELLRDVGAGCGEEALRVVSSMPDWIPGKQRGKNVAVYFNLPIKYRLDGKAKAPAKKEKETLPAEEEVFTIVEEMPLFPGCANQQTPAEKTQCSHHNLIQFITDNLTYPKESAQQGVDGKVVVSFIVSKTGEVILPEIKKTIGGLGPSYHRAVLDMMDKMMAINEKWIPGKQGGKAVHVRLHLPIRFKDEPKDPRQADAKSKGQPANTLAVTNFHISPNPVKDQLRLSFEVADYQNLSIQITDANGRLIKKAEGSFQKAKNERTFDVSNAPPGVLFVTLRSGDRVFTKQVVKQ